MPSRKLHVAFLTKEDPWGKISRACSVFGGAGMGGWLVWDGSSHLSREGEPSGSVAMELSSAVPIGGRVLPRVFEVDQPYYQGPGPVSVGGKQEET